MIRARAEVLGHRRPRLAEAVTVAHTQTTGEPGATVEVVIEEVRAPDQHSSTGDQP